MPASSFRSVSAAATPISIGHNKVLKKPVSAPAYTSGGSTHRVKVGKAAGYHPPSDPSARWSTKRGLVPLTVLHAHAMSRSHAPAMLISHTDLSMSHMVHRRRVDTCVHDQTAVCAGLIKRGRKGGSQIAIDNYTPLSWKDRKPITSHWSPLVVESMACIDCSTSL